MWNPYSYNPCWVIIACMQQHALSMCILRSLWLEPSLRFLHDTVYLSKSSIAKVLLILSEWNLNLFKNNLKKSSNPARTWTSWSWAYLVTAQIRLNKGKSYFYWVPTCSSDMLSPNNLTSLLIAFKVNIGIVAEQQQQHKFSIDLLVKQELSV